MNELCNTFKKLKKQGLVIKKVFSCFFVYLFEKMKFPKLQLLAYAIVQEKFPVLQYLPEGLPTNNDKIMIFFEKYGNVCYVEENLHIF